MDAFEGDFKVILLKYDGIVNTIEMDEGIGFDLRGGHGVVDDDGIWSL